MGKKKKHMVRGVETPTSLPGIASTIARDAITEFMPQGKKMRAQGTQNMQNMKRSFMDSYFKKKEGLKTALKKREKVRRVAAGLNE